MQSSTKGGENAREATFTVRDMRHKEKFQVDDHYFNGFSRSCGIHATGVYMLLCRHVNKDQEAWPGTAMIADRLGITRPTVSKAIKILERHNIVQVCREKGEGGKQMVNVYLLIDKVWWSDDRVKEVDAEPRKGGLHGQAQLPCKGGLQEGNTVTTKGTHEDSAVPKIRKDADIILIMDRFRDLEINLIPGYVIKTQRQACTDMIRAYGLEKTILFVEMAAKAKRAKMNGDRFAPVISRPWDLVNKITQLETWDANQKEAESSMMSADQVREINSKQYGK